MGKQLQTVSNSRKFSYLFTATTYSNRAWNKAYHVFQRVYMLLSFTLPFTFRPAVLPGSFLSQAQLRQSVPTNHWISSIQLYLRRYLPLEHLQVIPLAMDCPRRGRDPVFPGFQKSTPWKDRKYIRKPSICWSFWLFVIEYVRWINRLNMESSWNTNIKHRSEFVSKWANQTPEGMYGACRKCTV